MGKESWELWQVIDLLPPFFVRGEKIKSRGLEGKILGNIT